MEAFLKAFPKSPWRMAVHATLGIAYYQHGYFSRAIDSWEQSWREGKEGTGRQARALVDRAVGELARMHARLGHAERLEALLEELGDRPVTGPATETLTGAREGLWQMRHNPGVAYLCGPMALKNVLRACGATPDQLSFLRSYRSGPQGVSLREVSNLAKQAKLAHLLVFREPGQEIPVPSVIHWKVNHFAAVLGRSGDRYRLKDPTFGPEELWITQTALDRESSGYFLLPEKGVCSAWRPVSADEAARVVGMGFITDTDPNNTRPGDPKAKPHCDNPGCADYNFHETVVSLNMTDTPVGYVPPKGPAVGFILTYNQREANQPANFNYFNVGPKWTFNWLAYLQDDPTNAGANVLRYVAGG
ncbi:MAG TPA: cysteine peptidase family C39 domain-containing protein, partial [Planctomycetota bacterium]|nr:cysteine peptidase family C39 domain-containing protein [Planctomycetota bacterium]